MKVSVCLLCLKQVDEEILSNSEESGEVPLLTKFLKFAKNYLQVTQLPSTEQLSRITESGRNDGFCEKCELSVINPICTVYTQLLSTQLRLSWEVEQLEKVLKQTTSSRKLDLLTDKLGVSNLKEFRRSLQENCRLKRKEMLPQVLVERLMMIPPTLEFNQTEDEPNVKLETGSIFENDDDCDNDDVFDPLDIDTSHSLHSEGHRDENNSFGSPTSGANRSYRDEKLEICEEEITTKIEIVDKPQQLLPKDEDTDEAFDPTYSPDALSDDDDDDNNFPPDDAVKTIVGRTQVCGKQEFPCSKCSKIFSTQQKVKLHSYRVHGNRRYRCLHCKCCFKRKLNLVNHVTSIHKPEPQTCEQCGKVCKSLKALEMHVFWVHRDPIIQPKCPKCGKSFKQKHNIKKHLPICSGVK